VVPLGAGAGAGEGDGAGAGEGAAGSVLPLVPLGAGDLIDRAVLEPGGNISFIAKKPEPEEIRYQEVLKRLDAIGRDLAALKH